MAKVLNKGSDHTNIENHPLYRLNKWIFFGVVMGGVGGLLGAFFHHTLRFVTGLRQQNSWLVWLLPLGGLLTVVIYRGLRLNKNRGTNEIIEAVLKGESLKPQISLGIYLAATVTHLFGGSAGREGAALQLGGSVASMLSNQMNLKAQNRTVMIMCGMSAVFAGLFRTPLTAMLFCMEFESVGTIFSPALLPCFLAALIGSNIAAALGVHEETVDIEIVAPLDAENAWKYIVLAVLVALLGRFMCTFFHKAEKLAADKITDPWLRIALGGVAVACLTFAVGDQRYNGAGMEMALEAMAGQADWYDFALKMLFTALTLAAGFKGGEIVPTFCIGATFGCVVGGLLGLDASLAAAMGLVGLFCCATNTPLASILLSVELFGCTNVHLFGFVSVTCFVLSLGTGLYGSQRVIMKPPVVNTGK